MGFWDFLRTTAPVDEPSPVVTLEDDVAELRERVVTLTGRVNAHADTIVDLMVRVMHLEAATDVTPPPEPEPEPEPTPEPPPVITPIPDDDNGFTVHPLAPQANIWHVANGGADTAIGSGTFPLATIDEAMRRFSPGDRILLRRGHVFPRNGFKGLRGLSREFPAVVSYYGESGPRPRILTVQPSLKAADSWLNVAIKGIDFSPDIEAGKEFTDKSALSMVNPQENVLIEDCIASWGHNGMTSQGWQGRCKNITFRRNILCQNYTDNRGSNVYASRTDGFHLLENFLDFGGWHPDDPRFHRSIYNHNVYIQDDCTNVVVAGNISCNASSHGMFSRAGGLMSHNLIWRCPIGMYMNGYKERNKGPSTCYRNVIAEGIHMTPSKEDRDTNRGWGLEVLPSLNGHYYENMVLDLATDGKNAKGLTGEGDGGFEDGQGDPYMIVENNIVRRWDDGDDPAIDPKRTADHPGWTWRGNREITGGPSLDEVVFNNCGHNIKELAAYHASREVGTWDSSATGTAICDAMWEALKDR